MDASGSFPHLKWTYEGPFEPSFNGSRQTPEEVNSAKADRLGHSNRIKGQLGTMRSAARSDAELRRAVGLPEVRGKGFLLRVPETTDVDDLAHKLGIELVAETENGLMFAACNDIDLVRLEEVLRLFEIGETGGGSAASIIEVFHQKDDARKIAEILIGHVQALWPFDESTIYTFDLAIQTAGSTKSFEWSRRPPKRADQTDEEYEKMVARLRLDDRVRADEMWQEAAEERYQELAGLVRFYDGAIINGFANAEANETLKGITFPDSIEVRVRMSGKGFRDIVENFAHLFEVSLPPDIPYLPGSPEAEGETGDFNILSPDDDAPKVCVIDSGIQEEHRWLEPAIDKNASRCFLPGAQPDDVADYVRPRGHGTRVAGAVLYPREVPKGGEVQPVAWIQNARVLDQDNHLPESLQAERYLTEVVSHFGGLDGGTRIFNHSISESKPCECKRMSSWAAKIDDLAHGNDILFVQISGNLGPSEIFNSLSTGATHPTQLLNENATIANPGQSLHALTVGSVAHSVVDGPLRQSFARSIGFPSVFSRAGYSPLWGAIKPEVVEFGGDRLHEIPLSVNMPTSAETAPELVASTLYGEPKISRDDVGTSFAAPKVAHIAAHIQRLFPRASPQLYRALIVQSARWPEWAEQGADPDEVLRLIGYGIPSLERATTNAPGRVTLITEDAKEIRSKQYHLYQIPIPDEIRGAALEVPIRIDVTLAYTASPRRTRSRRTGYLETWLDWRSCGIGEPLEHFRARMQGDRVRSYPGIPWTVHHGGQWGEVDTSRSQGSVQKDWAVVESNQLPEDFAIAVRSHVGWNHKEGGGFARYCLVVSFEALRGELPLYASIEAAVQTRIAVRAETEVVLGL
ncbi:MAG: S8 family peptidase [Verrucomicrobia bacterium]|nr:S8 family peptidase [Verrucomicrobiota bacterium]